MGRPDEALNHLAATASPAVAHYNLGALLAQKGQTQLAVQHFQRAVELDPGLAPARQMLAQFGAPPPGFAPAGYAPPAEQRVAALPVSTPLPGQSPPAAEQALAPIVKLPPPTTQSVQPPVIELPSANQYPVRGTSYTVADDGSADGAAAQSGVVQLADGIPLEAEPPRQLDPPAPQDKLAERPQPAGPVVRAAYYDGLTDEEIATVQAIPAVAR
jgi:tetratricopeptide (TPR) repeat protein